MQPPYSGSPFNLVSGEDSSSLSRVMNKVQRVDHADQNAAWNHYIFSSRMISLLAYFMNKDELCHGFFLRWTDFYFSKSRIARFRTESLFAHGIPLGYKIKNTHLTFGSIIKGQFSSPSHHSSCLPWILWRFFECLDRKFLLWKVKLRYVKSLIFQKDKKVRNWNCSTKLNWYHNCNTWFGQWVYSFFSILEGP